MDIGDISGLILAITGLLTALGGGLAWLVRTIQKQSSQTITAKDQEILVLKNRITLLEMQVRREGLP